MEQRSERLPLLDGKYLIPSWRSKGEYPQQTSVSYFYSIISFFRASER
jgi:hypothetical protein